MKEEKKKNQEKSFWFFSPKPYKKHNKMPATLATPYIGTLYNSNAADENAIQPIPGTTTFLLVTLLHLIARARLLGAA